MISNLWICYFCRLFPHAAFSHKFVSLLDVLIQWPILQCHAALCCASLKVSMSCASLSHCMESDSAV